MKFRQSSPDPNATVYKKQRTFWISNTVEEILKKEEWNGVRSRLVDFLLCDFFNISYQEAYGRKALRHAGEERLWDVIRIYRKADITFGSKRKTGKIEDIRKMLMEKGQWPEKEAE